MARENMFEDFSKVASGAFSALNGIREEFETRVKEQLDRLISRMDLVTREEFEASKEMVTNLLARQEQLENRIADLEAALKGPAPADDSASASGVEPIPPAGSAMI